MEPPSTATKLTPSPSTSDTGPEVPGLDKPADATSSVQPMPDGDHYAPSQSSLDSIVARLRAFLPQQAPSIEQTPADASGTDSGDELPKSITNAVDFNPLPREAGVEQSSDEIFVEIGRQLRARREMLSLTYDEIERHTRVRAAFQKALEQGAIESLPSPVQTRGILSNYAAFIDLDVDAILLRFADGIQARHREQRPNWPPRSRSPMTVNRTLPPLRAFIASDLLFGGGAAIMLLLFAVWGINRVMSVRASNNMAATAPSISDVLAAATLPTVPSEVTLIPAIDTPLGPPTQATIEAPPPSPADPSITVQLRLSASERTYMRVLVDDRPAFEGRTEPGKDYYYQAARQVEVLVGNAAALRVLHNGNDLGQMGTYGQVIDQFYTARGVFTPTTTPAPTSTPSMTPTTTERPTPTLATFTPTAKPE